MGWRVKQRGLRRKGEGEREREKEREIGGVIILTIDSRREIGIS